MNFSYKLVKEPDIIVATAYTVQVLTDFKKRYLLARPAYVEAFCQKWKAGKLP